MTFQKQNSCNKNPTWHHRWKSLPLRVCVCVLKNGTNVNTCYKVLCGGGRVHFLHLYGCVKYDTMQGFPKSFKSLFRLTRKKILDFRLALIASRFKNVAKGSTSQLQWASSYGNKITDTRGKEMQKHKARIGLEVAWIIIENLHRDIDKCEKVDFTSSIALVSFHTVNVSLMQALVWELLLFTKYL